MSTRKSMLWVSAFLASQCMCGSALADASYQSSTQVTGGTLVDSLKQVSFLGKSMSNMFSPDTTTMVHGNQKATVRKDSTDIIDLDKGEMIHIDTAKKTYSVVTFAQMRQAMQNMPAQMQQVQDQAKQAQSQQPQMPKTDLKTTYKVDVKNTGVSKVVNGLMAQEQIVTMTMTVTDPNAAATASPSAPSTASPGTAVNSITYTVTTDAWIAPDPPQVKEIQDFDKRMAQKMMEGVDMQAWVSSMRNSSAGMTQLLGNQPGASDAMAQMSKEMAKLQGTRVMEVTSMGGVAPAQGTAQGSAQATPAAGSSTSGNSSGSVAGDAATDTAAQTAAGQANRMGIVGSTLGSSVLGAWHKKKAASQQPTTTTPAPDTAASTTSGQANQNVTLMSTTTQMSNFSAEPVPASAFQIPAGFHKTPSPYDQMKN
jgi:hypothetical protein